MLEREREWRQQKCGREYTRIQRRSMLRSVAGSLRVWVGRLKEQRWWAMALRRLQDVFNFLSSSFFRRV